MSQSVLSRIVLSAVCIGSVVACSKSPMLSNQLDIRTVNNQTMATLTTEINTQNVQIFASQIILPNPKRRGEILGSVFVTSVQPGVSQLRFDLNLTLIGGVPTGTPVTTLPNGTALPVAGIDASKWVEFSVGEKGSRFYLNMDIAAKKLVAGYALASTSLNSGVIANIFMPFTVGETSNVTGVGGIFSGLGEGQSGVALFADMSSLFGKAIPFENFADRSRTDSDAILNRLRQMNDARESIYIQ